MSDFSFPFFGTSANFNTGAATTFNAAAALPIASALPIQQAQATVFVDVGAKRIDSNVVRNGIPVGTYTINPEVFNPTIIDRPVLRVRVVSQSVPPGTPVPQGTSVTLTLASPLTFPVDIVAGTHLDLAGVTIESAYNTLVGTNPAVDRIVARASAGTITPADETAVTQIFAASGLGQVTNEPGRDVGAAIETLRALTAFGR